MKQAKKVYIDICTYCRPFDNQDSMRIRLETDAYYLILSNIQNGLYVPIISPVHFEETKANKNMQERMEILSLFNTIKVKFPYNGGILRERAEKLYAMKFGVTDAAHVAYAEATADFFITCDDKLLKKCRNRKHNVVIPAFNPVEFVMEENLK